MVPLRTTVIKIYGSKIEIVYKWTFKNMFKNTIYTQHQVNQE